MATTSKKTGRKAGTDNAAKAKAAKVKAAKKPAPPIATSSKIALAIRAMTRKTASKKASVKKATPKKAVRIAAKRVSAKPARKPTTQKSSARKTAKRHGAVQPPKPGKSARRLAPVRKAVATATQAKPPKAAKAGAAPTALPPGIAMRVALAPAHAEILSPAALTFLADLHRAFDAERLALLARRAERQKSFDAGWTPDFLPETRAVRDGDWKVASIPTDLQDRRVEITGPVDRKMIINALNSGAKVFMADFEDATSPVFANMLSGQLNLRDLHAGKLDYTDKASGKAYKLGPNPAKLMVRPRGWHLPEAHVEVDGAPMSGSLFDFGLYCFHNAAAQAKMKSTPAFYLPKMESHLEARLWDKVFSHTEKALGLEHGALKATVLIETLPAAFEMDEILYELRDHIVGLNCGRWDYIFSFIKRLGRNPKYPTPDRALMGMGKAFLNAYSLLLIKTCHRRGAFAMGGMAAQIPNRRDAVANDAAFAKVRADKEREAGNGHDGTWVAHPDLVPVAMEIFNAAMPGKNQLGKMREDVSVSARDLLEMHEGGRSEAGLRENIRVGVQYIEAWLRGLGAVPLYNLMEDAATAEISRAQVWQWLCQRATLDDGRVVTPALFEAVMADEMAKVAGQLGDGYKNGRFPEAERLFRELSLAKDCAEFLTLPAYPLLG